MNIKQFTPKWLFSTNHKDIGTFSLITSFSFSLQKRNTHTTPPLVNFLQKTISNRTNLIHKNVGYMLKDPLHQASLLNDHWATHYPIITQKAAKLNKYSLDIYDSNLNLTRFNNNNINCPNFQKYQEINLVLHFQKLKDQTNTNLLDITPFNDKYKEKILFANQNHPDTLFHFKNLKDPLRLKFTNSDYIPIKTKIPNSPNFYNNDEGNIVSVDLKNYQNQGAGINRIVSTLDKNQYNVVLNKFNNYYKLSNGANHDLLEEFIDKINISKDIHETHIHWINYAPSFYPYHPPLWILNNFNLMYLTREAKEIYNQGETICIKISDYLDQKGIPESITITPELSKLQVSPEIIDIITNTC